MGRPPKEGIDYAGWDTSLFDTDDKIDALIDSQGIAGFTVYFYLCQKAYAQHGYYLCWGSNQAASVSRRLGKGCSAALVESVVEKCLQICLFDRGLFDLHGILTSRGIQRRYWAVKKDRCRHEAPTEYWLLGLPEKAEDAEGLVPCTQNGDFTPPKPSFDPPEIDESKEKKRKENTLSKAHGKFSNVMLTAEEYEDIRQKIPNADAYIDSFSAKLQEKHYTFSDHHATILAWWETDKHRRRPPVKTPDRKNSSFDVSEFFARATKKG